ncbi:MAG: primosomal protein N', partial [Clostridia bacterium]|nr:primosomal protein N' [Clostridia bacterium]
VLPQLEEKCHAGSRVLIPFGMGNSKRQGMVLAVEEGEQDALKTIINVVDDTPVLTEELASLCRYMRETCFCTYYDAVRAMLPAGIQYRLIPYYEANPEFAAFGALSPDEQQVVTVLREKGETSEDVLVKGCGCGREVLQTLFEKQAVNRTLDAKRRMRDATQKFVCLTPDGENAEDQKLTPRQAEVLQLVRQAGEVAVKEILYFTGFSASVVTGLIKRGLLFAFDRQTDYPAEKPLRQARKTRVSLTDEQQAAADGLMAEYRNPEGRVSLLYGVTGSGKTQVFFHLVDAVIAEGRGVIVMVPEISLTPQMLSLFTDRYGEQVAVFHSAMSMGKRLQEWQRIRSGKAKIALGTRSAVFAPFTDLGLIIIDEEQEHTYKSEQSPRFHAREIAKYRTAYHKGLLCLASATPSVESFTAAKRGKYSLFTLKKRYGGAVLPQVETVDMKQEILRGNASVFSRRLYEAIGKTLQDKKQAIILLNRRGHNTYISCPNCGYVATCPHCSISLTYHSANKRMMCHYCGYSQKADGKCPQCGGEHMKFLGLGTQKAEEELRVLFP